MKNRKLAITITKQNTNNVAPTNSNIADFLVALLLPIIWLVPPYDLFLKDFVLSCRIITMKRGDNYGYSSY